eukprot:gene10281-15812_t
MRRLKGKRWSAPWCRSLGRIVAGRLVCLGVFMVLACVGNSLGALAGTAEDVLSALPPAQTRKVSMFSGGRLLVEYYPDNTTLCDSWILVPAENIWSPALRGVLYGGALIYVFLGIAIISDIFMSAIEKITSAKEVVRLDEATGETVTITVTVWNETVANLTLLALGSSAPEILLSIIETVSSLDSVPGELGASTIVGSAAFNLLCISGVCMWVVDEPKHVKEFGVFVMTTIASFLSYVWLVVVLLLSSKCEVEIWEALMTLFAFPVLVLLSWCQDRNWFRRGSDTVSATIEQKVLDVEVANGSVNQVQELWKKLKSDSGAHDPTQKETEDKLSALAERDLHPNHSRAVYKMNAVRSLAAGRQIIPRHSIARSGTHHQRSSVTKSTAWTSGKGGTSPDATADNPAATQAAPAAAAAHEKKKAADADVSPLKFPHGLLQWSAPAYKVVENEGHARLTVRRLHGSDGTVTAHYETTDGTAAKGHRYEEVAGQVVLKHGEVMQHILVPVIDDKQYDGDQTFYVTLRDPTGGAELGANVTAEVTVVDDDLPGMFEFMDIDYRRNSRVSIAENNANIALVDIVDQPPNDPMPSSALHGTSSGTNVGGKPSPDDNAADLSASGDVTRKPGSAARPAAHESKRCSRSNSVASGGKSQENLSDDAAPPSPAGVPGAVGTPVAAAAKRCVVGPVGSKVLEITIAESKKYVVFQVVRQGGSDGRVSVRVATEADTAVAGVDYEELDIVLEFEHTEVSKTVRIPITDHMEYNSLKSFSVHLSDPKGGSGIGAVSTCTVIITHDDCVRSLVDRVVLMTGQRNGLLRAQIETNSWEQQLREAVTFENPEDASMLDLVMHFMTMFWKVVFSIVPPTAYCGGWATFVAALGMIGAVTAIVAELASLFGCIIGLKDSVTAITFVALGTSLPDTFASKTAIEEEDYADAAIGNVMGSNSVNVLLGLGLPWTIATIYKESKGEKYVYPASGLVFSVILFLICSTLGVLILVVNRQMHGGELGGPMRKQFTAMLVSLW